MSNNIKIAVLFFPGNNRELETKTAVESSGVKADIVRWNTKEDITKYDGYVLPGGFSYEDRIRAGVISAKDPVMEVIRQEANKGKPVLGICNGAQVLVETKLVPGLDEEKLEMALAPNINPFISGYYCKYVNIRLDSEKKTAFTMLYNKGDIIKLPIAHAEGRFTTKDDALMKKVIDNGQVLFRYCDEKGKIDENFPVTPNKAVYAAAGICNKEGNVMALMPHPECGCFNRHLPGFSNNFEESEKTTTTQKIFESMKKYIEENKSKWR